MIPEHEYDDIIVTVAHPWGDVFITLSQWIARGPGPRPLVEIVAARRHSTDEPVDMAQIPLQYHNSRKSRRLQRLGQLATVWGPPPDDSPPPLLDDDMPPGVRRIILRDYYE